MVIKIGKCLWQATIKTIGHDGVEHAGYMSFMMLLSLFPFVIFFLSLTSFFGASEIGRNFVDFLLNNMPQNITEIIATRLHELNKAPPYSLLNLAIIGSIWTASSFVECLRTILNRVYEITSPPTYIIRRLLSILQFFIISILTSFTIFMFVIIPIALSKMPILVDFISGYELILEIVRYVVTFIILFISSATLYYMIPNVRLTFTEVIPGSLVTIILWFISGHFLSKNIIYYHQLNFVYGSIGSIIVTLIFFYIINMIFIYGAEFNKLFIEYCQHKTLK